MNPLKSLGTVGCQQVESGVPRKEESDHKHSVWKSLAEQEMTGFQVARQRESAEEQREGGRKVCVGHVVKSLACQAFRCCTVGTSPRRIFEPPDKHNISFRSINFP